MLHHGLLGELNDQGETLLVLSEKESLRMVGLIDSVLQLEKMRTGNVKLRLAAVDICELLDKCQDAVALLAGEKQIEMKREYAQAKGTQIQADAFWLQQVVVNILSNAIKFSPPSAPVTTALQTTPTEVVIRISDKGPGIPKDERKLVFERFHRVMSTSSSVAGSGLGLTISRELVEMHHGSIDIESEVGVGSTFNIRLPRSTEVNKAGSSGARDGQNIAG